MVVMVRAWLFPDLDPTSQYPATQPCHPRGGLPWRSPTSSALTVLRAATASRTHEPRLVQALVVKTAARSVGLEPTLVSGHSLRAGYCTQAAIAGLQPYQIREQTGHNSDATLARYIRPVAKRKIPSLL